MTKGKLVHLSYREEAVIVQALGAVTGRRDDDSRPGRSSISNGRIETARARASRPRGDWCSLRLPFDQVAGPAGVIFREHRPLELTLSFGFRIGLLSFAASLIGAALFVGELLGLPPVLTAQQRVAPRRAIAAAAVCIACSAT